MLSRTDGVSVGLTPEQHLRNLLARIHRDGGHYADEHGLQKATDDADALIVQWLARDDAAGVRVDGGSNEN